MKAIQGPTGVEKVAGSPVTEGILTATAAAAAMLSSTPGGVAIIATALPILAKSVGGARHLKRMTDALEAMNTALEAQAERLDAINDAQYQLINELVVAAMGTADEVKLGLLRDAAVRSLDEKELPLDDAVTLGRIIRDITTSEVRFLVHAFNYSCVSYKDDADQAYIDDLKKDKVLIADPKSAEGSCLMGLVALGVMHASGRDTWDAPRYDFGRLTAKLIALLRPGQGSALSKPALIESANEVSANN